MLGQTVARLEDAGEEERAVAGYPLSVEVEMRSQVVEHDFRGRGGCRAEGTILLSPTSSSPLVVQYRVEGRVPGARFTGNTGHTTPAGH